MGKQNWGFKAVLNKYHTFWVSKVKSTKNLIRHPDHEFTHKYKWAINRKYKKWPSWLMSCLFQLRFRPIQTQSHEDGIGKGQSKACWNFNRLADLQSLWQIAISQCQLMTVALWLINCSKNDQENYLQDSSFSYQCLWSMKSSFFLEFLISS